MGFSRYGDRPSEYYFIFLYSFIYITIVNFFYLIKKEFVLYFLIGALFIFNFSQLKKQLKSDPYALVYRDRLVKELASKTRGKKFNISYIAPLGRDTGFRYLVEYYEIRQTSNWSDPLIQIKIPGDKSCQIKSKEMGILIPPELR